MYKVFAKRNQCEFMRDGNTFEIAPYIACLMEKLELVLIIPLTCGLMNVIVRIISGMEKKELI